MNPQLMVSPMRIETRPTTPAAIAAALFLLAITVVPSDGHAQGNSAGKGKGGGHGYAYGRDGGDAAESGAGGSAGGAPLPLLGATALGQAAGVGGLLIVWLRRRRRRAGSKNASA